MSPEIKTPSKKTGCPVYERIQGCKKATIFDSWSKGDFMAPTL